MTPKIFLSGRFDQRENMAQYASMLNLYGYEVVSTWVCDCATDRDLSTAEMRAIAIRDLRDLDCADVVVHFAADCTGTGGRHVEVGYALANGKRVIHVGQQENIYHALCDCVDTFDDLIAAIDAGRAI